MTASRGTRHTGTVKAPYKTIRTRPTYCCTAHTSSSSRRRGRPAAPARVAYPSCTAARAPAHHGGTATDTMWAHQPPPARTARAARALPARRCVARLARPRVAGRRHGSGGNGGGGGHLFEFPLPCPPPPRRGRSPPAQRGTHERPGWRNSGARARWRDVRCRHSCRSAQGQSCHPSQRSHWQRIVEHDASSVPTEAVGAIRWYTTPRSGCRSVSTPCPRRRHRGAFGNPDGRRQPLLPLVRANSHRMTVRLSLRWSCPVAATDVRGTASRSRLQTSSAHRPECRHAHPQIKIHVEYPSVFFSYVLDPICRRTAPDQDFFHRMSSDRSSAHTAAAAKAAEAGWRTERVAGWLPLPPWMAAGKQPWWHTVASPDCYPVAGDVNVSASNGTPSTLGGPFVLTGAMPAKSSLLPPPPTPMRLHSRRRRTLAASGSSNGAHRPRRAPYIRQKRVPSPWQPPSRQAVRARNPTTASVPPRHSGGLLWRGQWRPLRWRLWQRRAR